MEDDELDPELESELDVEVQDVQTLATLLAEALELADAIERREAIETLVEGLSSETTSLLEDALDIIV